MKVLIGNTPMIQIKYKFQNKENLLYVKLEQYNLTGSIKDRIAWYILENAKADGILKDGAPIIEATSGNTGISFAALGAKIGHPVYIYMPDWVSRERIELMKLYGANVILVSKEEGGFEECIKRADALARKINGYRPDQFSNTLNSECHYINTGKEILDDLDGIELDGFVSGIGSGGTIMGIGRKLKEKYSNLIIGAVEPDKMPLLTGKEIIGNHKIEGIGDDFVPDLVNKKDIDVVYDIDDNDAVNMARIISKALGIGVGISSGANMIGSILLQSKVNGPVVTLFPDDNKKYLTTDLIEPIDNNPEFISNQIELLEYSLIVSKNMI